MDFEFDCPSNFIDLNIAAEIYTEIYDVWWLTDHEVEIKTGLKTSQILETKPNHINKKPGREHTMNSSMSNLKNQHCSTKKGDYAKIIGGNNLGILIVV